MNHGYLSRYFEGAAVKTLSAVEADLGSSNQHEYNGVGSLKKIFGEAPEKRRIPTRFVYLSDNDDEPLIDKGFLTWYDARAKNPRRSEHRLYFPTTSVSECAAAGDTLVIAATRDGGAVVVIAEQGSTVARQVQWLFGVDDVRAGFSVRESMETEQDRIGFAAAVILEQIGIEVEVADDSYLDQMLAKFGAVFPPTRIFSAYARSTIADITADAHPDEALLAWMEQEEILFRTLEKHIVGDRLTDGFDDVEVFIKFSLSVQNRRKSRVGHAFENHLSEVFSQQGLRYSRTAVTENNSKPDFLFPGQEEYLDASFPDEKLLMLGAKSTCKDRWRQVLAEAARIPDKHLVTLQPAISQNQTDEMQSSHLQLVVPAALHTTYNAAQRDWLMNLGDFVGLVRAAQI